MFNRTVMALVGAVLIASAGSMAHAQTTKKTTDFSVRSETLALASPQAAKALKFDARKGRWGVTLNLQQPDGRDTQWNDVQAGAYFRVTPSLRVGGAVALGEKETPMYKKTEPQAGAPRVRLETAFKF
jgi:hypothetical protein